ncbi:MAG: hypothetical protein B7Y41_04005 [Hydrogenophilales bacterium 28-61-23]|nr:MAG: hypothetical protein B7Y41_04005 [Hydrogenophilales bacterium 28-61-23]
MAQLTRNFLICLFSFVFSALALAENAPLWAELSIPERTALTPIAYDWDHLPAQQRHKLLKVAKEFAKLTPTQQQIFYSRLQPWTRMSQGQRDAARNNFKKLQELPRPEQAQIKQLWLQTVGPESAPTDKTPGQ